MSWKGIMRKAGLTIDNNGNVDFEGYLKFAGSPIATLPFGDQYNVDYRNGDDDNRGRHRGKAFKTYGAAVDATTTNNNDVIFIDGDSTVVETAMVDLTKSRVHTVGVNGPYGHYGQGRK